MVIIILLLDNLVSGFHLVGALIGVSHAFSEAIDIGEMVLCLLTIT